MRDVLLSLASGVLAGFLFAWLHLPVPAPATIAGVAGVGGLFLGYVLAQRLLR